MTSSRADVILAAVLKWLTLAMARLRTLRLGLLVSAARVALSAAILSSVLGGEPAAAERAAMAARPEPAWGKIELAVRPTVTRQAARTATPVASATPQQPARAAPVPTATLVRPAPVGAPTWIEAPAIQLSAPVVESEQKTTSIGGWEATAWDVPDDAAGFHKGTAYPGQCGNTVISGHNNIGGAVFRRLVDMKVGDEVILYVDKTPYRYVVSHTEIVLEQGVAEEVRRQNARWIAATEDERLTLITCWPYTGNSHRVIVVAMPSS